MTGTLPTTAPDGWVGPEQDPVGPERPGWPPQPAESRILPSMSDPAWRDPRTVWQIAAVRPVDPGAHMLAHPRPVFGCPACPQSEVCPSCLMPASECPDPVGHRRTYAAAETTWRVAS